MKILLIANYRPGAGGISSQVEQLQKHLTQEGEEVEVFSTKASVWKRLGMFFSIFPKARKFAILHIHCCSNWGFLPAVIGITAGKLLKKRLILTYHGGGGEQFFAAHRRFVKFWLSKTDANIVLSGFLAKVFSDNGIPHHVLPNILDIDDSLYRERAEVKPNFISIRTLTPLYNVECIIRAFAKVKQQRSDATLTVLGDGESRAALEKMVKDGNIQDVSFVGRVKNEEVYGFLDKADILLSTPHIDNQPMSILEAFKVGLLVISTNVGGVPYMIREKENGMMVADNDSDALAEKMVWAVTHQAEAKAMMREGHKCLRDYSWENIKGKLFKLYRAEK